MGRADGGIDALPELGRADEEEVFLLVAGDENVVLVLALLPGPVLEGGHSVAILSAQRAATINSQSNGSLENL